MLVELAVGDAYGAGFEYSEPDFVTRHNTLLGYVQHPRHPNIRPGQYTDDTQMTLAIAELLLREPGSESGIDWTPTQIAQRFVEVYRRDERYGYSRYTHAALRSARTGAELLTRVRASETSGAAMRVAPIGLLADPSQVRELARAQAAVTHDTPAAGESAQAAALAVHYCHHRLGPTSELAGWLGERVGPHWATPWVGAVGGNGMDSVRAAVTALSGAGSLSGLLRACIAYTGDVDTVAAIALAAGSRAADLAQDLPEPLLAGLENGAYGRDYLRRLDQRLLATHPPGR